MSKTKIIDSADKEKIVKLREKLEADKNFYKGGSKRRANRDIKFYQELESSLDKGDSYEVSEGDTYTVKNNVATEQKGQRSSGLRLFNPLDSRHKFSRRIKGVSDELNAGDNKKEEERSSSSSSSSNPKIEEVVLPSSGSTSSEEEIKPVKIEKTEGEEKSEEAPIVGANTEDKPEENLVTKSDKNSEEDVISPAASPIEKAEIKVASTNQELKQNPKQELTVETEIKLDDKSDDKNKSGNKPNPDTSSNNPIVEPAKLPNVDNTSDNTKSGEGPVIEKEEAQQIKVKGNDVINTTSPTVNSTTKEEQSPRTPRVVTPQLDEELQEDSRLGEYYNVYPSDYTDGKNPKSYNDKTSKIAAAAWRTNASKKFKLDPNKLNSVEFEVDEDGLLVPTSSSLDEVLQIQKKQYPYTDEWIKQQQELKKDISPLLQHNAKLGDDEVYSRFNMTSPDKEPVVTPSGDIIMPLDEQQKTALQIIEDEDPSKISPITYEEITQREDNIYDEYERVFRNNPDNSPEASYELGTYVDLAQIAGASDIKVTSDNIEEYTQRGKAIREEFGKEIKAKTDIDLNYDQLLDLDILFKMEKSGGDKKRLKLINYTDPSKNSKLGFLGANLQANYKDRGVRENQNKATYDIDKEALIQSLPRDLKSRIDNAVNSGSTYTYKLDKNDPATIMLALINPLSFDKGPDYIINDTKETLNTALASNKGMFDAYDTDQDGIVTNGEVYKQLKNKLKSIKSEYGQSQGKSKTSSPTEILQATRIAQATVQADQTKVASLVEKAMTYIDGNSIESFVTSLNKKTSNFTPAKAKLLISEFMKKGISLKYDPKSKQFKYVSSTAETPKYQQGGRIMKFQVGGGTPLTVEDILNELINHTSDADTYIARSIAAFEQFKGGPNGNPLTIDQATANPSLKDSEGKRLPAVKNVDGIKDIYLPVLKRDVAKDLGIEVEEFEKFPVDVKLKLLDYKFNASGRSARDLVLFAAGEITAEQLNGNDANYVTNNTKAYENKKSSILNDLNSGKLSNLNNALYTAYSSATDNPEGTKELPNDFPVIRELGVNKRTYYDDVQLATSRKSWIPRVNFNIASAAQYVNKLAENQQIKPPVEFTGEVKAGSEIQDLKYKPSPRTDVKKPDNQDPVELDLDYEKEQIKTDLVKFTPQIKTPTPALDRALARGVNPTLAPGPIPALALALAAPRTPLLPPPPNTDPPNTEVYDPKTGLLVNNNSLVTARTRRKGQYVGTQGPKSYQKNPNSFSNRAMSFGTKTDKGLQIQSYPMLRELAVSAFTLLNKETVPLEADRKPDYYIDPVTGVPANTKAEYRRQLGRNYSNQVRSAETSDIRSRQAGLMMANTANIDGESKLAAQDAQTRLQDRARFAQEKQAYTSLNNQIDNKNIAQRNQAKTATAMDNVKRRAASVDFLNQGAIAREYDKKNFNNLLAGKIIEQREDNYSTDRFRKQNQYIGLTEDLANKYSKNLETLYQADTSKGNLSLQEWTSDKIKVGDAGVMALKNSYDNLNKDITETFMQDLQEYESGYQNDQINFIKNAYRGRFNTKRNPNSSSPYYTNLKNRVSSF